MNHSPAAAHNSYPPLTDEGQALVVAPTAFERYAHLAVCLYALVAALSIAASKIVVVGLTLWWIGSRRNVLTLSKVTPIVNASARRPELEQKLVASIALFLCCAFVAAALGLDASRASVDLLKLGFGFLFPFVIASTLDAQTLKASSAEKITLRDRIEHYLLAFGLGQLIAAAHSIGSLWAGKELPIGIPGPVTESGQIVLILLLFVGISLRCYASSPGDDSTKGEFAGEAKLRQWFLVLSIVVLTLVAAWPHLFSLTWAGALQTIAVISLFALILLGIGPLIRHSRSPNSTLHRLRPLLVGVFFAVLLCNLKRGPWLGLLSALILFGCFYSKRLVVASVLTALATVFFIRPIQERFFEFAAHFTIAGGRRSMWEIGFELVQRFPLGIGLDNARYMRVIDPSLPDLHRHMHSNPLNITVETGFLGFVCYLWFFLLLCAISLKIYRCETLDPELKRLKILAVALGCALIGWQVSGLVEYNFGDSEIRMIAFTYIGMLLAIVRYFDSLAE